MQGVGEDAGPAPKNGVTLTQQGRLKSGGTFSSALSHSSFHLSKREFVPPLIKQARFEEDLKLDEPVSFTNSGYLGS